METVELTLYRFDELTDKAKENAIADMDITIDWFEVENTLKAFEEHMCVRYTNWEIDPTNSMPTKPVSVEVPWYFEDSNDSENIDSLRDAIERLGSYDPDTKEGYGDCVLTSAFWDEEISDGARKAFLIDGVTDRKEVARKAFEHLERAVQSVYADMTSEWYIAEVADMNDWRFTDNGTRWNW